MRIRFAPATWSALLAALVLLAGCDATAANAPARPHGALATATSVATFTPSLSWRTVTLPQPVTRQTIDGFAVSLVDGRDAWLCVRMSATSFAVWATRDFGSTWADMGTLPRVTTVQGQMCDLVADANDASSLAAIVTWGSGEAGTLRSATLISTDGGAHWSRVSGDMQLMALASQGATTYAIFHDTASPLSNQPVSLVASTDSLRTWRSISPSGLAAGDNVFMFWLRPASTEVIAASTQDTLWRSTDGGAHWTSINTPHMQVSEVTWQPTESRWVICGSVMTAGGSACSTDLGQTWPVRPNVLGCFADAMLSDGALLAACPPNGGDGTQTVSLYEMPWGATTWTNLGMMPDVNLYVATPAGQLWCGSLEAGRLEVTTLPS